MKSIVVTGASSGIGRATALRLARKGWQVFAAVRKDSDRQAIESDALQSDIERRLEPILLDVTDFKSIERAAHDVGQRLGGRGLDGLFNNAGVGALFPVEYTPLEKLREIFEINLFGQIATTQAFLPLVRAAKGRIINVCSVGDYITPPFVGLLSSSKAAFASMSAALRLELRPEGIAVCVIEPGSINTPAVGKTLGGVEQTIAEMPADGASRYGEGMRQMAQTFTEHERAGSPPEVVAETVERALTDRRPQTRYQVGKDSTKLTLLARFLPEKLLDIAVLKTFGLMKDAH